MPGGVGRAVRNGRLPDSGLTSLQTLVLSNCDELQSLDLSGHHSLLTLDLGDCDGLASLDVSGLTTLRALNLGYCGQLASLDVSGLTSLLMLDLGSCTQLGEVKGLAIHGLMLADLTETRLDDVADLHDCKQLVALSLAGCKRSEGPESAVRTQAPSQTSPEWT
jgi:hypothetical protein